MKFLQSEQAIGWTDRGRSDESVARKLGRKACSQ